MGGKDGAAPESQPIFAPVHMCGAEEIAAVFGVHVKTVRDWKADGAPILMLGKKYQANYYDLWEWLKRKTVEGQGESM